MDINSPEAESLARKVSASSLADELNELAQPCAALLVQDIRSPEEIVGYDENGVPR